MGLPEPGTRIELVRMGDDPNPIPRGTRGTVKRVMNPHNPDLTQIVVAWDNGRSLMLVPGVDTWREVADA